MAITSRSLAWRRRVSTGVDISSASQIFVPVMMRPQLMPLLNEYLDFDNRRTRWVNVFGRLKPGVSREQAQASLQPYFHCMLEMEVKQAAFSKASRRRAGALPAERDRSGPRRPGKTAVPGADVYAAVGA